MKAHAALDVSELPTVAFDSRAPLWWGNLLLLCIETTAFAILVATYFYYRQNYTNWPPPLAENAPALINPVPDLILPGINLVVILASCLPMIWADRSARRGDRRAVLIAVLICVGFGLVAITLRSFEFFSVKVRFNSNAYGSVVWALLIMHMMHLIIATLEAFYLVLLLTFRRLDGNRRLDTTVTAVYWYWVALVWIPIWAIIYLGPRFH